MLSGTREVLHDTQLGLCEIRLQVSMDFTGTYISIKKYQYLHEEASRTISDHIKQVIKIYIPGDI